MSPQSTEPPEGQPLRESAAEFELAVEALKRSGRLRLPVSGVSMAPVLVPGDEIEVRSCRARDLHLGDIALFAARDTRGVLTGLVVHRLLLDREEGLIARGDGAASVDPIWSRDSVLGVVSTRLRNGIEFRLSPRRRTLAGRVRAFGWGLRIGTLGTVKQRVVGPRGRSRRAGPGSSKRSEVAESVSLNLRFPEKQVTRPSAPTLEKPELSTTVDSKQGPRSPFFGPPTAPSAPSAPVASVTSVEAAPPKVAATATPPERPTRPARERRRRRRGGFTLNPLRWARRLARR